MKIPKAPQYIRETVFYEDFALHDYQLLDPDNGLTIKLIKFLNEIPNEATLRIHCSAEDNEVIGVFLEAHVPNPKYTIEHQIALAEYKKQFEEYSAWKKANPLEAKKNDYLKSIAFHQQAVDDLINEVKKIENGEY